MNSLPAQQARQQIEVKGNEVWAELVYSLLTVMA
jgi:hypothetical protein